VLGKDHFTAYTLVTVKTSGRNLKAVALKGNASILTVYKDTFIYIVFPCVLLASL